MNTKTTLVLSIVALVVVGYLFLVEKPWDAAPSAVDEPKPTSIALFDPKPEDVDRMEVQRRIDGRKLVFVKDADANTWTMTEPIEAPAAEHQVSQMVKQASELKFKRRYDAGAKDRPSDRVTGLDNPVATVRLFKDDKELAGITIGEELPTGQGTYLRVNRDVTVKIDDEDQTVSTEDILESETALTATFNTKIDTLRDKNVLKFNLADVKSVRVEGDRNYVLVKNGDEWLLESPIRGRADKDKAESLVRALTNLNVSEFKVDDPVNYAPYQLDRLKITVQTEKTVPPKAKPGDPDTQPADIEPSTEQVTYELLVGGEVDNTASSKQYFSRLGDKPWVFSISEYTYNQLSTEVADLQNKELAAIDRTKVKSIKADTPDGSMVLTKQDDGTWADADGATADQTAVEDLLRAASELKATNFVDPRTELIVVDWDQPRARITLTEEGSLNPVTLLVGPDSASGRMVFVRNAAEDAVAAVREDAVVQLLAGPVAYRDRSVMRFDRTRTNRVEISQPGKDTVALVQKENQWSMVEPIEAPVDRDAVRNLMQDISSLQARRVVGSGDRAAFGLDAPAVTIAAYVEPITADPNVQVVGEAVPEETGTTDASAEDADESPAEAGQLAAPEDQGSGEPDKPAQTQPAATQPSKRPTKTIPEQIAQIEQLLEYQKTNPDENPLATQMLRDQLAKLQAQTQPATEPAESAAPDDEAATAEAPTPAPAPVPTPAAVMDEPSATAPAGKEPTVLRLHLAQKDGKIYAAVDDKEMIYEIDEQIFTDATVEFHDRQIIRFESDRVTQVEFAQGDAVMTFRKVGEDWKYALDSVLPIDKEKVTEVLDELKDVKTHRFISYKTEDLAAYGLDAPARRFAVILDGGESTEVLISSQGPQGDADGSVYATRTGENKVFLLTSEQVKKFNRDLDDFEQSASAASSS